MIELVVAVTCIALLVSAFVMLGLWLMEQFKDEKPSWESFIKDGKKHWLKK